MLNLKITKESLNIITNKLYLLARHGDKEAESAHNDIINSLKNGGERDSFEVKFKHAAQNKSLTSLGE